jgi:[acyl-carrier-protein] S-malonyltransferase
MHMPKIAFMFPGVGSQYVGMGRDFYDRFPLFRRTFEEAGEVSGRDLAALCFETGPAELARLENAQLAILTVSVGVFRVFLQEIGVPPDFCLGHSLGEYSALCCAGVIAFADALKIVSERGTIIGEAASSSGGTMMWVINLDQEKVVEICREVSHSGEAVFVSAFDSPSQTSISGRGQAVMTAARKMEEAGAIVYPLKMSGPFHSPLMAEAGRKMRRVLEQYAYGPPVYPVIANRHARPYGDRQSVIDNLSGQLVSPIRWRDSLDYLWSEGVGTTVEMGPKNVLTFLIKKNSEAVTPFKTDTAADLMALKGKFLLEEKEYIQVIGRCLGIAAGTRNRNRQADDYERRVIAPYRKVAGLYEELKAAGRSPTLAQVEEVLDILRSILTARGVPESQQESGFDRILDSRMLRPPLPGE